MFSLLCCLTFQPWPSVPLFLPILLLSRFQLFLSYRKAGHQHLRGAEAEQLRKQVRKFLVVFSQPPFFVVIFSDAAGQRGQDSPVIQQKHL